MGTTSTGTMFPNDLMSLMNNLTSNIDATSNKSSREKKNKLVKVCIDRTRSALNKMASNKVQNLLIIIVVPVPVIVLLAVLWLKKIRNLLQFHQRRRVL